MYSKKDESNRLPSKKNKKAELTTIFAPTKKAETRINHHPISHLNSTIIMTSSPPDFEVSAATLFLSSFLSSPPQTLYRFKQTLSARLYTKLLTHWGETGSAYRSVSIIGGRFDVVLVESAKVCGIDLDRKN